MDDRELLHWIVDELPSERLDDARVTLGALLTDPTMRLLMTAPPDDEPAYSDSHSKSDEFYDSHRTYSNAEVEELLNPAARRLVG